MIGASEPYTSATTLLDPHEGIAPVSVSGAHEVARLVTEPLPRTIARLGLPAVASMLLMTLFYSVDTFWIGRYLGATALAAASTALFWIWMIVSGAEMVSIGLTAVAARRHGERNPEEAARVVGEAIVFAVVLGLVVALVGTLALERMFEMMDVPAQVVMLGKRYLGLYLIGAPFFYGYFAMDAGFRASGDTRTPFVLLAASVAVSLVLDPVLILGLAGAPQLGVAGAALATVVTRSSAFALGIVVLRRRGMVRFDMIRAAGVRLATAATIARVGLPAATTGVAFSIIYILMTRTTAQFGTPALAAIGIGQRVESWLYMMSVGFGAAVAAIVGQNLGAGETGRAERTGWIALGYVTMPAVLIAAAQLLAAPWLARVFTSDAMVVLYSADYLRIAALSSLVLGSEVVLEAALGGAGATLVPMLVSTAITVTRIPLAAWAAARFGVTGIWWVISLTAAARGVAMALLWGSGFWKGRRV